MMGADRVFARSLPTFARMLSAPALRAVRGAPTGEGSATLRKRLDRAEGEARRASRFGGRTGCARKGSERHGSFVHRQEAYSQIVWQDPRSGGHAEPDRGAKEFLRDRKSVVEAKC